MRVPLRVLHCELWFVFCFASLLTSVRSAEPEFTPEQRQRLEEATRLNDQALKLHQQGRARDALVPARQALAIRKALLGEKQFDTANSLNALGVLQYSLGDYAAARTYFEQAFEIYKLVLDEKHPNTAQSLNNLGMLAIKMGDFAAARSYLEQALANRKAVLGVKHPETAGSLNNLGSFLRSMGDYAAARPYLEQGLAIRKAVLGEKHPDTAVSLDSLGSLILVMGDSAAARPYLEQALAIRKVVLGEKHPDTARSLNNLGISLKAAGDNAGARLCLEEALAIYKNVLGDKHPHTANSLNSLGGLLHYMGEYVAARTYYEQALKIRKEVVGERNPDTAGSYHNLGQLLKEMGDYAASRPYLEQALAIRKAVLGEKHPNTGHSLSSLGSLLDSLGDYAAARSCFEQALAINKEMLGEKHPDTAMSLDNLATLLKRMGEPVAARLYYEQALAINKAVLGEKHPSTALSLNNLGLLLTTMGDDVGARSYHEQSLAIHKEVLGEKHRRTTTILYNLAVLEGASGNWNRSFELVDEARHAGRAHLLRTLPGMASAEQLRYLQTREASTFRAAVTIAVEHRTVPNVAATSAAWLINGKATAQEALAQQAILATEASDPVIADSVKRLLATRRELANLVMTTPKPGQAEGRQQRLAKLESEERILAREVGRSTGRPAGERDWIELNEVRQAIAADAVLIDLVRYEPFNFQAKLQEPRWGKPRYAAWLIPAAGQGEVEIVDLGPAAEIEALVAEFQEAIRETNTVTQTDVDGVMERLAELLYKPLAGRLASVRHWLVSPDGALWTVPWAALRLDPKTYAIEKHEISYLVSSRDLVNRPARGKSSAPVVMADPDFALSPADAKAVAQEILTKEQLATRGDSTRSRDTVPKRWRRLEGTAAEAAAIGPQLQAFAKANPRVFLRERALETVAKNLHGPRVLVLSTHGFFLPDQPVEDSPALDLDDKPRGKLSENPLLRCGIVLAGANQLADGPKDGAMDDGLLTGLEIVACDLRGTELTVLSACQTGVGDVHSGQGVAGLRQAFQLAGSECVMASLWEVPDQETAELMKVFYENLAAGQTKAVALGNAQRSRIAWRRKQSLDSHPWFWAAFTVTGK
jgi:CHAT domain-containing protein/tetratricopeptide (TPR) repeat protein